MKKTKHFNKNIYETEKKIKAAFIILVTFLIRNVHRFSNKLFRITKQRAANKRISGRDRQSKRNNLHTAAGGIKNETSND